MKIEKISDNQIRCTLDKNDLTERKLKISELAYGSEKTKELFTEICKQASVECNFETENLPLMIEAIPVSPDCLVLVVTKVTDPDELDVRFSNFTSSDTGITPLPLPKEEKFGADDILGCLEHLGEVLGDPMASKFLDSIKELGDKTTGSLYKIYRFSNLDEVIGLAKIVHKLYKGVNTLYKDSEENYYYLVVNISEHTAEEFNKICNILAEYSVAMPTSITDLPFFEEHFEVIVKDKAIQVLWKM